MEGGRDGGREGGREGEGRRDGGREGEGRREGGINYYLKKVSFSVSKHSTRVHRTSITNPVDYFYTKFHTKISMDLNCSYVTCTLSDSLSMLSCS